MTWRSVCSKFQVSIVFRLIWGCERQTDGKTHIRVKKNTLSSNPARLKGIFIFNYFIVHFPGRVLTKRKGGGGWVFGDLPFQFLKIFEKLPEIPEVYTLWQFPQITFIPRSMRISSLPSFCPQIVRKYRKICRISRIMLRIANKLELSVKSLTCQTNSFQSSKPHVFIIASIWKLLC